MTDTDAGRGQIGTQAADVYDDFGPVHRVLHMGCGTGVLARAATRRVGASGR